MKFAQVLQPAFGYAQHGCVVTPVIANDWVGQAIFCVAMLARATFLRDSQPLHTGEWFTNPDYARILQQIATELPATFCGGSLGQRFVARIKELGGFVTIEDLKNTAPN